MFRLYTYKVGVPELRSMRAFTPKSSPLLRATEGGPTVFGLICEKAMMGARKGLMKHLPQKLSRALLFRLREHLLGRPLLGDLASIKENYPVSYIACEAHLMGDN